jgi:hypothetical protein
LKFGFIFIEVKKIIILLVLSFSITTKLHAQEWIFARGKHVHVVGQLDTVNYAFPLTRAGDSTRLDTDEVIRRTKYVHAFREPVLFVDSTRDRMVRFTWLRSNDHPVMVRLVIHNDTCTLYWKECDGKGINDPGTLVLDKQKAVPVSAWRDFRRLALKLNNCKVIMNNGTPGKTSDWMLEGEMGGYYQLVRQGSPVTGSEFYKCCDYLIGLTDMVVPEGEKY